MVKFIFSPFFCSIKGVWLFFLFHGEADEKDTRKREKGAQKEKKKYTNVHERAIMYI
jgi:hypothetical protein